MWLRYRYPGHSYVIIQAHKKMLPATLRTSEELAHETLKGVVDNVEV